MDAARSPVSSGLHGWPRRAGRLWFAAIAAATVLVIACGSSSTVSSNETGDPTSSAGGFPIAMYQGEEVVGGTELDFAQILNSGKPVVLNFWAGLCPPCRAEMPSFQIMYDNNKDDLILIGVDIGPFVGLGSTEDGRSLLEELGITYPAGQALSAQVVRQFNVLSMPTTVFFDASGREVDRHSGFITEGQLSDAIDSLLSPGS